MRLDSTAGTTIVQTLGRLVLAAAFIPTGYIKLFTPAEYTAEQAAILQHYGVPIRTVETSSALEAQTSGARQSTQAAAQEKM